MALFTAVAGVRIYIGNQLPNDAQIVQSGLNTVVGAAAAGDFEFVRQLDRVVAQIKLLVDFFTQSEGVIQAVLAGGSLAGDTGRTREPVPPVMRPAGAMNSWKAGMSSK